MQKNLNNVSFHQFSAVDKLQLTVGQLTAYYKYKN